MPEDLTKAAGAVRKWLAAVLRENSYARDTLTNTLGLLAAAALPVLILPILARLYSPEDFGLLGVTAAATGLGTIASTGRYEAAILLPKRETDAIAVAMVAACFVLATTALLGGAVCVAWLMNVSLIRQHAELAILVVVSTSFAGSAQILINWAIRGRRFALSSMARIASATTTALASVVFGLLGAGAAGLAAAAAAGYLASCLALGVSLYLRRNATAIPTGADIVAQARKYRDFPLFSLPSDLANTLATNLPVLFFSTFFGAAAAGYLTMFQRIWAGTAVLVQGLGETFRQRAASERHDTGSFVNTMNMTFRALAALAVVLFATLLALGPLLFELFMGPQWREAGVYGQILAPLVCLQFIASPLSWSFYLAERLRLLMAWQWLLLATFLATLSIGGYLFDAKNTLLGLSLVGSVLYAAYTFLSLQMAATNATDR
ncbi:oligosaccharide flippase family protein [Devosia sp. ZB163]|uniref:lipopolysaccharide biosynthesis protein n=1 Tax=Devosia sp. ZB163 TaxID=3025938 RepID=UPI00235E253D|nr:oligosaccharide flippase family protein [Devosia sp. ZB163]MDC9823049.1 oligosaccharide flippase family protein [Devosia sp. ZB163]